MTKSNPSNNRIAKNTFFMYIRSILILFVSLYTSRVLLQALGQTDFGVYNVVAGFVTLLTFLNTAMVNSTQRFLNFSIGKGDKQGYVNYFRSSLLIQIVFALILLLFAETIGYWFVDNKLNIPRDRHIAALFVYQFALLSFILKIVQAPFSAVIVSNERMSFYAFQGVVESFLLLFVAFGVQYTSYDRLETYSVLLLIISLVILVINIIYVKRVDKGIRIVPLWNIDYFKSLLSFSGWNILGSLSTIAKSQGLNIILNIFFDVIVNAARGVAGQVFSGVSTFIANFQTAFKPQLIQSYAEGNIDRYIQLTFLGTKISAYIMWIFSLPIILTIQPLLSLWLGQGNVPLYADSFTILALLTGLIDTYASPIALAVSANGNIKSFQISVSLFKVLILPIAYVLCKIGFSPEMILLSGLVLDVIALFIRLYFWKKVFEVSIKEYLLQVLIPTSGVILITFILCYSITSFINRKGLSMIIITTIISIIVNFLVILYLGLKKQERDRILKVVTTWFSQKIKKTRLLWHSHSV